MGGDDFGNNRQPQSGAAALAGSVRIQSDEAVEDSVAVFNGDSWPVVGDTKDCGAVDLSDFDAYPGCRVADSVVEQVA
jgi:hypothetical protein